VNPPAAAGAAGAGAGAGASGTGAVFAGADSGSFSARKSWVNPPAAADSLAGSGAAGADGEEKEKSLAGFCGSRSEGNDASGAGAEGAPEVNIRVKDPGSLEGGACGGGAAGGAGLAAGMPDPDWNIRVNSPGSLEAFGAGAGGAAAGAGDGGACAVPESALNICVKLLGASDDCVAGWLGPGGGAACAGSGEADAGFSMETWRKMFASPPLGVGVGVGVDAPGVPGVLKVCNILVNSPGAEEARATGGAGAGGVGADAAGAGGAGSEDGRSRDASRSSSETRLGVSFTLPKAAVMLSGSEEPDGFSPGTPGAPKGVLDSLIKP
jgi:hypothetical protein